MIPSHDSASRLSDDDSDLAPSQRRMFLFEKGWRINLKTNSTREFCYQIAPGDNHYHRLLDGEVYLQKDDERLCLACASRRGLIADEPRRLKEILVSLPADDLGVPLEVR